MLYLEDYLEMIEHLPQELRDRFTEMRELDLTVQNSMDSLEKKTRNFFQQCKRGELLHENADAEFQTLRREYYKVMEDADEKVAIATQIHELVERYLRRLDSELFKFKCELEADNNGITEILEKRSLELDGQNSTAATALMMTVNQKENRYYGNPTVLNSGRQDLGTCIITSGSVLSGLGGGGGGSGVGIANSTRNDLGSHHLSHTLHTTHTAHATHMSPHTAHTPNTPQPRQRKLEKRRETICTMPVPEKRPNLNHALATPHITANSTNTVNAVRPITNNLTSHTHTVLATGTTGVTVSTPTAVAYNLQQLGGAATSAIAAAASQAIVATQQMQQGRRTASLKASYEAIHGGAGVGSTDFWITNAAAANAAAAVAAHSGIQAVNNTTNNHHHHHHHHDKKQKKKISNHQSHQGHHNHHHHQQQQQQQQNHHHHNHQSVTIATNATVPNLVVSRSTTPNTPSVQSTISLEAIDIITTMSNNVNGINVNSIAISNVNGGGNVGITAGGATVNSTPTTNTVNCLPSTSIAPGANITIHENGLVVEQTNEGEWSYDPNEPRYCTCNQVSYGDMVACDNDACPYEWFHYPCVGITQPPKGKWYCPKCTASMRRRGNRKN